MMLKKCLQCGSYTLKQRCVHGHQTVMPRPPKFSPEDAYGKYRRMAKQAKEQA